ncbi:putative flippase GtrA [Pseudoduganella lurida]|uniref:Putative flippase GtrA n=1 Tax=Pseudoduganella lurida TaxID=1036180 RepID=A0A562R664_9BURK|nr:GtrA family protein [Pseudoduganella lurida]TWI64343.1 putative flippase GtrA [Pseudoduganella lurida]
MPVRTFALRYAPQLRFLVAGAVNTLGGYLLYLLLQLVLPYQVAYFLAFVAGVVGAYCLNTLFVFRTRLAWRTFLAYPAIYIVQYFISAPMLAVLVEWLHVPATVAPLIVSVVMIPVSFLLNRYMLLRGTPSATP